MYLIKNRILSLIFCLFINCFDKQDAPNQCSSKRHNVRHYQLLGWPNNEVFPPDKGAILSLIEEVHRWQQQQKHSLDTKKMGHMVIHCL